VTISFDDPPGVMRRPTEDLLSYRLD